MITSIIVKYIDDFGKKHICTAQDMREVKFLQERFEVIEIQAA